MTSRHPETRPPSQLLHGLATVLLLIGIQAGGFRRDVVPGDLHVEKLKICLKVTTWNRVFWQWLTPKHHGVARIDLHTTCQVPPDKTGVHLLSLVGARSLD